MKKVKLHTKILLLSLLPFTVLAQISIQHPNDVGIQNHANVLFTEMFEQNTISTLTAQNGYTSPTMTSHILFDSSVPMGSNGGQSLKLRTVETSTVSNDPNEDSNLLIKFPSISDSIFVRYYVKYNSNFTFHHTGVWVGGTDPNKTCWPCYKSGRSYPTNGDSAFVIGTEVGGPVHVTPQSSAKVQFYNYWMDMNIYTSGPNTGKYYGNEFISPNSNAAINLSNWNCIELMIKLNNPVNDSTGELKLWINGQLISHYGKGFPNGTWNQAFFNEGVGTPFEGFRWRSNPAVAINYVWLKNYSTDNTSSANNDVLYDHLVVAKSYIGPIAIPNGMKQNTMQLNSLELFPNPANNEIYFSKILDAFEIYNLYGEVILKQNSPSQSILTEKLKDGIYFLKSEHCTKRFIIKH